MGRATSGVYHEILSPQRGHRDRLEGDCRGRPAREAWLAVECLSPQHRSTTKLAQSRGQPGKSKFHVEEAAVDADSQRRGTRCGQEPAAGGGSWSEYCHHAGRRSRRTAEIRCWSLQAGETTVEPRNPTRGGRLTRQGGLLASETRRASRCLLGPAARAHTRDCGRMYQSYRRADWRSATGQTALDPGWLAPRVEKSLPGPAVRAPDTERLPDLARD